MTQKRIYTQQQSEDMHRALAKLLSFQEIFREDVVQDAIMQCEPFAEIAWAIAYIEADKLLDEIEAQPALVPSRAPQSGRYRVEEFLGRYVIVDTNVNPFKGLLYPTFEAAQFAIAYHENAAAAPLDGESEVGV